MGLFDGLKKDLVEEVFGDELQKEVVEALNKNIDIPFISELTGVLVDKIGRIRLGASIALYDNLHVASNSQPGYGLFQFGGDQPWHGEAVTFNNNHSQGQFLVSPNLEKFTVLMDNEKIKISNSPGGIQGLQNVWQTYDEQGSWTEDYINMPDTFGWRYSVFNADNGGVFFGNDDGETPTSLNILPQKYY